MNVEEPHVYLAEISDGGGEREYVYFTLRESSRSCRTLQPPNMRIQLCNWYFYSVLLKMKDRKLKWSMIKGWIMRLGRICR